MEYLNDRLSIRTRRSVWAARSKVAAMRSPPVSEAKRVVSKVCSPCQLPGACSVPSNNLQLSFRCMHHLMSKARTWACVYNIGSWCAYDAPTYACFAQDEAPEGSWHAQVLAYRDLEQRLWSLRIGRYLARSAIPVLDELTATRNAILLGLGAAELRVCAFYPVYRDADKLAFVNRVDPEIPKLLARRAAALKARIDFEKLEV